MAKRRFRVGIVALFINNFRFGLGDLQITRYSFFLIFLCTLLLLLHLC
jgi:hypothetical protein